MSDKRFHWELADNGIASGVKGSELVKFDILKVWPNYSDMSEVGQELAFYGMRQFISDYKVSQDNETGTNHAETMRATAALLESGKMPEHTRVGGGLLQVKVKDAWEKASDEIKRFMFDSGVAPKGAVRPEEKKPETTLRKGGKK